jgi:death-on-curing protein
MFDYLEKDDIIQINYRTYKAHGGTFIPPTNFLHEENLDYLLEAVQSEMFGEPLYPTIADKSALYMYNIVCNHIFQDGNKRTGLEAALAFLDFNEFSLNSILSDKDIELYVLDVASGNVTLDECRAWFAENIVAI